MANEIGKTAEGSYGDTPTRRTSEGTRRETVLVPAVDIHETPAEYTLKFEIPGVPRDGVTLTMENDELEIQGNVPDIHPAGKELQYAEYSPYGYYRKFRVGNDIDRDHIVAKHDLGVLTVTLPKVEEAKPRRIEISTH